MFSLTVLSISANFIEKIYIYMYFLCLQMHLFVENPHNIYAGNTSFFFCRRMTLLILFWWFFFFSNFLCCFLRIEKTHLHHVLSCVVFMLNFFCCESNFALTMQSYYWLLEGVENLAHCWLYAVILLSEYGGETSRTWTGTRQQNPVWNAYQVLVLLGLAKQVS